MKLTDSFRSQKDKEVAMWCANRMSYYDVKWGTDGHIAVPNADGNLEEIGINHIRSIIRRDYLERHPAYPGLSKIISDVVNYALRFSVANKKDAYETTIHGKIRS